MPLFILLHHNVTLSLSSHFLSLPSLQLHDLHYYYFPWETETEPNPNTKLFLCVNSFSVAYSFISLFFKLKRTLNKPSPVSSSPLQYQKRQPHFTSYTPFLFSRGLRREKRNLNVGTKKNKQ